MGSAEKSFSKQYGPWGVVDGASSGVGEAWAPAIAERGVNVVLGATDTPAFREVLADRGILSSPDDPLPIPCAVSSDDTVAEALANLTKGPTFMVGDRLRERVGQLTALGRNGAVVALLENAGGVTRRRDPDA